jgi:hypothetical protein
VKNLNVLRENWDKISSRTSVQASELDQAEALGAAGAKRA